MADYTVKGTRLQTTCKVGSRIFSVRWGGLPPDGVLSHCSRSAATTQHATFRHQDRTRRMWTYTYSKHKQHRRATAEHMARTALLALLAREVQKAGKAGRSNAGLRVVKSDGECESVWGPRRKDGVKMRDTLVGLGGRCDLIPPGAHVEEAVEGLWLI